MLYKYEAKTPQGEAKSGTIDAANLDLAISNLQRQGLIIVHLEPADKSSFLLSRSIPLLGGVKRRDLVLFSRQIATLFEAKVSIVDSLKLLIDATSNYTLRTTLEEVLASIQGGLSISQSLARHTKVFSDFYVSMVKSGEETGKLGEIFTKLADHLEYSYDLRMKVRNALLYPAFVVSGFIVVVILMMVVIMPKLAPILQESNTELPWYTKLILGSSSFFVEFGIFILIAISAISLILFRYGKTKSGKQAFSRFQLKVPIFGQIYRNLFLQRMTDNLETSLSSGITVIKAFEITSDVVGNEVYSSILKEAIDSIKGGSSISEVFARYEDMPLLISQMIKVGEETGELDFVLRTLSKFYKREAESSIGSIVTMIEPIMIAVLGLGIGLLAAGILGPIYNITGSF